MTNNELKQIRLSMSLTQSELAKLLHVSLSSIARWERGIMSIPEYMAELLGYKAREQLTPDYFELGGIMFPVIHSVCPISDEKAAKIASQCVRKMNR